MRKMQLDTQSQRFFDIWNTYNLNQVGFYLFHSENSQNGKIWKDRDTQIRRTLLESPRSQRSFAFPKRSIPRFAIP